MARRVVTYLDDDIDGSVADETVRFGVDQQAFEIDLSANHAEELRSALSPWIAAARRRNTPPTGRRRATRTRRAARTDPEQLAAIRAWARSAGYHVSDHGRIPEDVRAAYNAGRSRP